MADALRLSTLQVLCRHWIYTFLLNAPGAPKPLRAHAPAVAFNLDSSVCGLNRYVSRHCA